MFARILYSPDKSTGATTQSSNSRANHIEPDEEFFALMSLALDDMLSPVEAEQFQTSLAERPELNDAWMSWLAFDRVFRGASPMEPPSDFVSSFETRLLRSQRRKRLWLGLTIGLIAAAMWGSLVIGLTVAGVYVLFDQSAFLAETVRYLTFWYVTLQNQLAMLARAVETTIAAPQTQGVVLGYTLFASVTLWLWTRLLRKSMDNRESAISTAR